SAASDVYKRQDLFNSIVGVPRSVAFLESEIARLTETMDVVGRGRNKGNGVAIRVKELREELRSAREISADANDIEKVISQLDAEIVGFQATLDKFDGAAPRATVKRSGRQRGGSRVNPEAKEFQEATTGLEAAIARREALQDRIEALNKPGEAGGVDDRGSTASAAIERRIQALEMEEKQLGKTRRQSELLKLENQGATVEELALADAALTGIEAFERRNEELQSALDLEEEQRHAFQSLQESLRTEEEAITESYERRLAIILQNTEEGADRQIDLIDRLNERLRAQIDDLESEDFWTNYLNSASDALTDFDELAATTIENFSTGFGNAFEKMIFDSESLGDAAAGMAEGMARSVVSALGKMGAEWLAYQAVQMVVGKTTQATAAAGIIANAQAASIQSGINAFSSTAAIPIVGPALAPAAMAAALAVTQPMAASVASLSFAGAFDEGGKIPSGSFGIVGEFGPEFVRGPANVTSRKDTMDMVRSGGDQKITIINQGQPVRVISDTRISDDERQIIIADAAEAAEDRIASGIVRGDSNTSAALESTFSLDRSAGSRR
ncbi:MAG: hypothetical protein KUG64_10995, partial [Cycloclasticus sp.]|nr:hypothetical protein [Cycloclasticus sp.]